MRKLSPFKRGLLSGLVAITITALIIVTGVVVAQFEFDPQNAVDNNLHGAVGADSNQDPAARPISLAEASASASISSDLQVFQTSLTYQGDGPAGFGRTGMHAACRAQDPAAHFCTLQEVETAWKAGGLNLILTSHAWIDNAIVGTIDPGYTGDFQAVSDWYGGNTVSDHPHNCNAWTVNAHTAYGLILYSGSISPASELCDDTHPIACCKRVVSYWIRLPLIIR